MVRLIDADFLYDKVESRYRVSSGIEHRGERDFLDLICAAPVIVPESLRPTAHWISVPLYVDGKRKLLQWCSLCNCPEVRKTK